MKLAPHLADILYWRDLYLAPLYVLLVYWVATHFKKKYYSDAAYAKYLIPALMLRIAGCIFLSLLMQFYYHEGDTFSYFTGAREIWQAFVKKPSIAFEIILNDPSSYSADALEYTPHMSYSFASSHLAMFKISGIVGLFAFGSYLPIAIIFTSLSFYGTWLIYIVFLRKYPDLWKRLAITTLFIPSLIVWSTVILKEPLCMFAIGLSFYSFDNILRHKKKLKNVILFAVGSWLLITIKDYLFYSLISATILYAYFNFLNKLKPPILKNSLKAVMYILVISMIIYFFYTPSNMIINEFTRYFQRADNLQNFMIQTSEEFGGAAYTLPTSDFSNVGILKSFLLSLNVALFRPYIWECTNPLMLFNFFESFVATILVLLSLIKLFIGRLKIRNNPLFIFCLVFTLLVAFMAGFISYNFGTLIRYKVPFQPFFYSAILILLSNRTKVSILTSKPDSKKSSHTTLI
ncbi:MAG: hypothetical protein ABJA57_03035 [Ginsengibacter sp.]